LYSYREAKQNLEQWNGHPRRVHNHTRVKRMTDRVGAVLAEHNHLAPAAEVCAAPAQDLTLSLNFSQCVEGRRWCQWTREGLKEARVFAGDAPCHGTQIPRACARSDARQRMSNGAQSVYRSTVVTSYMAQVLLGEGSAPGLAACPSSLVPSARRNGGGPHGAVLASLPFGGRTMRSGWARVLTRGAGVTPSAVP